MPPTPPLAALAALTLVLAGCASEDTSSQSVPEELLATVATDEMLSAGATVERVVDGDTFIARLGDRLFRVRLIGINTPESVDPDRPVECYGPEAAARTGELLREGAAVRLETDPTGRTDDFGRLLAYAVPEGARDTVNETLLREGYANVYVYDRERPFWRVREFRAARDAARREGRGLWGACTDPGEWGAR